MFDPLGLTTRLTLILSPPFFVLAYVLFAGIKGSDPSVMIGVIVSFLLSVALSGWVVRSVVSERRTAKRTAQALLSAEDNLATAKRQAERDRELQRGFEELEEALIGGLAVEALADAVISRMCLYVGAPVGAIYLKDVDPESDQVIYRRAAGFALGDLDGCKSYRLGEGLVGQAARTGKSMQLMSPSEAPLVTDDGLRRRRSPNVLILWPIADKDDVLGVIVLGLQETLKGGKKRFSERILTSVAMAFQTAFARRDAEATLKDYKDLATRLQDQAVELEKARLQSEVRNKDLQKAEADAAVRAEEAGRANEYKSEFLANMSHELRTPLNSVILLSKLLAEGRSGPLSDDQSKQASVIHQAGNDLLSLINDILDLSKIEAGRMSIIVETVELDELLAGVIALFAPLAEGKNVALNYRIDSSLPPTIITDTTRIKQILRNFLSNAVKFVDHGEVCLIAEPLVPRYLEALNNQQEFVRKAQGNMDDYLVLAVSDTGIGIAENRQTAIFDAFRQADGTTSRKYGGTGLGLNIVTKLSTLLGGAVGLWSTTGEGSTFFVVVPRESIEQHTVIVESSAEISQLRELPLNDSDLPFDLSVTGSAGERAGILTEATSINQSVRPHDWAVGKRLLLVDDDMRNSYALTIVLEAEGFEVTAAPNGMVALELVDAPNAFDGVLMDIMMPEMDGYEAMRRLRADGRFNDLPILALTARTQEEDRVACFDAGASDFLPNPSTTTIC